MASDVVIDDRMKKLVFATCFLSLIATAFGFIVRSFLLDTWATEFNLSATQKGEVQGYGLWPFAISIILFSLVIDKVGYGRALWFAWICHVLSAVLTITATSPILPGVSPYGQLCIGTFIAALANGTVEAVINPVIATIYTDQKVKWLNILHAGWPGGLVLGGILALIVKGMEMSWKVQVGLILVPTAIYGVLLLKCKWPVHERVAAGVSYRDMLSEFGVVGCLIVSALIIAQLGQTFAIPSAAVWAAIAIVTGVFGAYIGFKPGRGMFIALILVMIPLATTELGVDGWVTSLMGPEMGKIGIDAGWILIYTSAIMMVLRFCAGPIVHKLSPLGLLATCSTIACLGLIFLSKASGASILLAATMYGVGKTFFWPTMLGIVAEQFPKGGALTLNATGGVGMLGVGIVGTVFLGNIQDTSTDKHLKEQNPAIYQQVSVEKSWLFGKYTAVDQDKAAALPEADKKIVDDVGATAKKDALSTVAIFPLIMVLTYAGMMAYYYKKGGYKAEVLTGSDH